MTHLPPTASNDATVRFSLARRVRAVWRTDGVAGVFRAMHRRLSIRTAECWPACRERVAGQSGLEIGGPSSHFAPGGLLPLYPYVASVDNCDFSGLTTVGQIVEGQHFVFDATRPPGQQFVRDAVDLHGIPDGRYGFLLASHVIEHLANPLRALAEWSRVLTDGGTMVLVVPHRDGTFDHRRPVTRIEHVVQDFVDGTQEDDLTHLAEVLALHDFRRDPKLRGREIEFARRCRENLRHRWLHHHVFDTPLVAALLERARLQILALEPLLPHHILAVVEKPRPGAVVDNERFVSQGSSVRTRSPFPTDRA